MYRIKSKFCQYHLTKVERTYVYIMFRTVHFPNFFFFFIFFSFRFFFSFCVYLYVNIWLVLLLWWDQFRILFLFCFVFIGVFLPFWFYFNLSRSLCTCSFFCFRAPFPINRREAEQPLLLTTNHFFYSFHCIFFVVVAMHVYRFIVVRCVYLHQTNSS